MNKNCTELVFVLDRSGSMSGLEEDTIGGFNAMLKKQKAVRGEALVTTVLFDNEYEVLHNRENIRNVRPLTPKDYYVRGSTALLDAVGRTINRSGKAHAYEAEENRPGKVLFVIITDGMENASCEFGWHTVKKMIEHQKNKYRWEFIYLGANIDAAAEAARVGIAADRAANYHADARGTALNYAVVSEQISCMRSGAPIDPRWKEAIDNDYKSRKKRKC